MKIHHVLFALAAVACAGNAGGKSSGETGSTSGGCTPSNDEPFITSVSVRCDGSGEDITFEASTDNLTFDGYIWLIESGYKYNWSEEHDLISDGEDSCGRTDHLSRTVSAQTGDTTGTGLYERNHVSLENCDKVENPTSALTYVFAVNDQGGNLADCVAAGDDPEGVINGEYSGSGVDPTMRLSSCTETTLAR